MPKQESRNEKQTNPNMMPDKKQVRPENTSQVEKEGQQFDTQNKNPETYNNGPKVEDPKTPNTPDRVEVADDIKKAQDVNEGEDEPNPYHELQGNNDRGVGEDKAEGERNLH